MTIAGKQRWRCITCNSSFTRKRPDQRVRKQQIWFQKWVCGYTLKQLSDISGHSVSTLQRILLREIDKPVPLPLDLSKVKHLLFDAKFLFGRKYCLLVILNAATNTPVAGKVVAGETRACITPWLEELRAAGLSPIAVTTDGRQSGIYAFRRVWPEITVQRCLFHIRMQAESWCRAKPKYACAAALKQLCEKLCWIKTVDEALIFRNEYWQLREKHQTELELLDSAHPVQGDIIRAYQLIKHAMNDCFYYLEDPRVAKTTSPLEGYFKQIQRIRGFQHNGLTETHLFQFLAWKLYFDSKDKHTF